MIFAADARTSREYAGIAVRSGALVVDNSSAFRLEAGVPLIVPEVNGGELARGWTRGRGGLIANRTARRRFC